MLLVSSRALLPSFFRYLKQVALIVLLAQIGCYVPAEECFVPVRKRLLSRIGSGDDIENNLSTFLMVSLDKKRLSVQTYETRRVRVFQSFQFCCRRR